MKKILALFLAVTLCACGEGKSVESIEKVYKIGVILPLSGNNAFMGRQMQNGYEFVRKYLNPDIKYELVYFDDMQQSAKAIAGVQKLVNVDKVDALLTGTSQTAAVVAPVVSQAQKLHLGISSDNTFTKQPFNYTIAPNSETESAVVLEYLQQNGYKNIALISANEAFGDLVEKNMQKLAPQYGAKIVFNAKITPQQSREYRLMLKQALLLKPDIFVLQSWPPEIDILTKQLLELDNEVKITSLYSFFISSNPALYQGRTALNVATSDEAFKKAFLEEYHTAPEQMSITAYAQLAVLLDMLDKDNLQKVIQENKSILGQLSLENRSIRYRPQMETIGEM